METLHALIFIESISQISKDTTNISMFSVFAGEAGNGDITFKNYLSKMLTTGNFRGNELLALKRKYLRLEYCLWSGSSFESYNFAGQTLLGSGGTRF